MRSIFFILAVLALALGNVSAAGCTPTSTEPFVAAAGIYATNPLFLILCHPECLPEFWVYEESNGIEGLQRQDEQHDDTCGGQIPGDTILL